MPALRHYFNVSNSYVMTKLRLLLFPWRNSVSLKYTRKVSLLTRDKIVLESFNNEIRNRSDGRIQTT